MDLILRPSGLPHPTRTWALQLRDHGPAETDYHTLARISLRTAQAVVDAGAPYWLFGAPEDRGPAEAEFTFAAAPKEIAEREPLTFALGERVRKNDGYRFPGVVVCTFWTLAGRARYVVEAEEEGFGGLLHVFSAAQLVSRDR